MHLKTLLLALTASCALAATSHAHCGSCGSGGKVGAKAAKSLGYTRVMHYSAGISGWKDSGEPVGKSES